ncbi:MAG TPA: hypothetical protein PK304_03470, partial [Mobilitalea sp.]|nr:hypothetical protein [Mobilitalea sp.]
LLYKKRVLLMQTHISMNNLEGPLVGKNVGLSGSIEDNIFQDIGLDAAVMYSRINMLNKNTLESCCITFPDTSLLLLPGTEIKNREIFAQDIGKNVFKVIQDIEKIVDIVMIDTNSGNDDLSFKMISSADLTVINLTQRRYVLDTFFQEYEGRFDFDKVFFLIGNYDKDSGYNISNFQKKYRKYIGKNNSGVIPYSTRYLDALNECELLKMVRNGLNIKRFGDLNNFGRMFIRKIKPGRFQNDETDYFFYQACQCAEKIIAILNQLKANPL